MGKSHVLHERLKNVTWAWFCSTMATGSVAVVIYQTPYQFRGLTHDWHHHLHCRSLSSLSYCPVRYCSHVSSPIRPNVHSLDSPPGRSFLCRHLLGLHQFDLAKCFTIWFPFMWTLAAESAPSVFLVVRRVGSSLLESFNTTYTFYLTAAQGRRNGSSLDSSRIYPLLVTGPLAGVLLSQSACFCSGTDLRWRCPVSRLRLDGCDIPVRYMGASPLHFGAATTIWSPRDVHCCRSDRLHCASPTYSR